MSTPFATGRHAGLLVPLFSLPSARSWGIGEIGDLAPFAAWLREAGLDFVQLLPVSEMAAGQHSPYSAMTAMAIDPIYISVYAVEDFTALGGEAAGPDEFRRALGAARASRTVQYRLLRGLKMQALAAAFARFHDQEWARKTTRAAAFREYVAREAWWLEDYALFRALHARHGGRPWMDWEAGLRDRRPDAIARARGELAREIVFYQYLQWMAQAQWQAARAAAAPAGLFGDVPFMVGADSADVWARREEFDLTVSVGTPPDEFSADGQNWQLPAYRWDVMARRGFDWLRARARRSAALYDAYRVDHLVGFYRTYVRPHDGSPPHLTPAAEREQLALGERVLAVFREAGAHVIAEDLGTVPDFVRASLARLGVPGCRVLRWERQWKRPGQPFRDPLDYPAASVATTGTHDTEPLAVWWDEAPVEERRALGEIPALRARGIEYERAPYTPALRDAILELLFASGSGLLVLPIQDVFGWRDRINVPAVVSEENWTYRLPWFVDELHAQPEARERAAALCAWAERYRRIPNPEPRTPNP